MLRFFSAAHIILAVDPVDMRKSFEGLYAVALLARRQSAIGSL